MNTRKFVCVAMLLVVFFLLSVPSYGQGGANADRMKWWREARFGLFIHWGPVSLKGTEIGWSRGGERRGTGGTGQIPLDVYDNLYKEFNPVEFDAKEWVSIAKNAGMKYLVFTTKHHDGFCMFDSALTDYKITNTPFKRDIVKELADACHEGGLGLGWYYSPPDWHHPDYRTADHAKYIEYLHGQIRELLTNYGKVDVMWFDGLGGTAKDWDSGRLVKMIRELQPGIIINNRAGLPEDHDTPEQRVGTFQNTRAWETCMTLGDQWAFKPNDRVKTFEKCIDILVNCAGGDGNLLLNVGPTPTGRIETRQISRLAEIGAWMSRYGQTIYDTRGGPFLPQAWGASTYHGPAVYVHVLDWKAVGEKLVLPGIPAKIEECTLLTGGTPKFRQTRKKIEIQVPETARQEPDTIIVLQLDKPASEIEPVGMLPQALKKGMTATASNFHQNDPEYAPIKAFDGIDSTRWATDGGTHSAWLEVKYPKKISVAHVIIKEACGDRVEDFSLQYGVKGTWKTFHEGKKIGEEFHATVEPVRSDKFRLEIKKATEGPTLWEFQLLPPMKK